MLHQVLFAREFMSAELTYEVLHTKMLRIDMPLEVEFGIVRLGAVGCHAAVQDDEVIRHFI